MLELRGQERAERAFFWRPALMAAMSWQAANRLSASNSGKADVDGNRWAANRLSPICRLSITSPISTSIFGDKASARRHTKIIAMLALQPLLQPFNIVDSGQAALRLWSAVNARPIGHPAIPLLFAAGLRCCQLLPPSIDHHEPIPSAVEDQGKPDASDLHGPSLMRVNISHWSSG